MILLLALTACAGHEGLRSGLRKEVAVPVSPVVEKVAVAAPTLPPEPPPVSLDYRVGVGDLLSVNVYARPDLSTGTRTEGAKGSRVDGDGNVHLPLVGAVPASGRTVSEIRATVEKALTRYLQEPSAVVEVVEYHSRPLYLMGQFRTPGVYYMDRPLSFLQGISLGSGFDASANLRGIRLLRDSRIVPVDLYSLLLDGRIEQNVWLRGGDTVFIPDNRAQFVFVFGAVNKPGPQPMPQGRMNLLEAVAAADVRAAGYDLKNVRIIRSLTTTTGELLVVDVERIRRGEALPLQLMEGDVVYIPKTAFGTWNDVIADILPSLQAVSAFLQPFVSIQYLTK